MSVGVRQPEELSLDESKSELFRFAAAKKPRAKKKQKNSAQSRGYDEQHPKTNAFCSFFLSVTGFVVEILVGLGGCNWKHFWENLETIDKELEALGVEYGWGDDIR